MTSVVPDAAVTVTPHVSQFRINVTGARGISGVAGGFGALGATVLSSSDMASVGALQSAITANAGKDVFVPTGTWPLDFMSSPTEIDISLLGGLFLRPGAELVSNCPVRGILRASAKTRLQVGGFRGRWEFDGGDILRPDLAWNESNEEMFDWIDAWNAAFGTSISTAINGQGFNQRWDNYHTALETEAWNQISAGGRASGLLLNGCNEIQIYDFFANNCVAQINDQGGVVSGDGLDNFGTYIDQIKMGDDQRFGYLGKRSTALKIDRVICDVNGTRDNGGAPHILYFSGNPTAGDVTTALDIGSIQISEWGIAPAVKFREASVNIGSIISKGVQSVLGMVHCTGSVGPVTCTDQKLARDEDGTTITAGSGSKFAINLTNCYDLSVGRVTVQQRASTGSLTQHNLRVADLAQCTRIKFEGFDVSTHRLSTAAAMVRLGEVTHSHFGVSSITNTGTNTVNLYEMPVDDDVGGANTDNHFAPVRTSANAQVALLEGASKRNTFTLDPRLLNGGFEEDVNVQDLSFGASNNIALVAGERIVPITSAPSFETKANDTFLANYTDDDEVDGDVKYTNFAVGNSLTIDGRTYTFVSALTGNDQVLRSSDLATNLKRVRAAMNGESLSGSGNGVIYQTASNHATYFGVSSGRALTAINRTAGSAGNGDVMTATGTNGAWVSGTSVNGGELDTHHLNATLAITTSTSNFTFSTLAPAEGTTLRMVKTDSAVGSFAFGDFEAIRRQNDELRVVYTDGAWRGIYAPSVIRGISHGDVFIPEALTSAAINAEIARMGARDKLRLRSGKTYAVTSTVDFAAKQVLVDADGAKLNVTADVVAVSASSGFVGPLALSANYVPGARTITLASVTGLVVNRPIRIVSDAIDPSHRNSGTNSSQYRLGESAIIVSIDTGTKVVTLGGPLKYYQGLSTTGGSVAGDRAVVETYTTANNARVVQPSAFDFAWYGGEIAYEDGHDATDGSGWKKSAWSLVGYADPILDGLLISRGYHIGINLITFGGRVNNCNVRNLSDYSVIGGSASNLGYGVLLGGHGSTVTGLRGSNTRHLVTSSGTQITTSETDPGTLWKSGPTRDCTISDGVGGGQLSTVWDTHSDAHNWVFRDCRAIDGQGPAFNMRGRENRLIRPFARCRYGISALQEFQDSGGVDLAWSSGQGRENATSCYVESANIICEREALEARGGHIHLSGENVFVSGSHDVLVAPAGGFIEITGGRTRITITGDANAYDDVGRNGVIDLDNATAAQGFNNSATGFVLHRGASLDIFGTDAANSNAGTPVNMMLFSSDSTTRCEVYGNMTAALNNNFTAIEETAGRLTVDQHANFTITGTTATRETRSYFHTDPSGTVTGTGFINDLADDIATSFTVPVSHGIVEVFTTDAGGSPVTAVAMSMAFNDNSASNSELASLLTGNTTYCEVVVNTALASAGGTDGKLVLSYHNNSNAAGGGRVYISNRLGQEIDLHWRLTGSTAFGAV
jgi:hypothetical protein